MAPSETVVKGDHVYLKEEWMQTRFKGTTPADFPEGTRWCCIADIGAPPGFDGHWCVYKHVPEQAPNVTEVLALDTAAPAQGLVIFCDPTDEAERTALCALIVALDALGQEAPPMILAVHSVAPDHRDPEMLDSIARTDTASVIELGLDGAIFGEARGFALSYEICSKFRISAAMSKKLVDIIVTRREMCNEAERLKHAIHNLLWDYLRKRFAQCVPALDRSTETEDGRPNIAGYEVGKLMGKGANGRVYKLVKNTGEVEVLKTVCKSTVKDTTEIACTKRMIRVMTHLSSEEWSHPNVTKLYQVYHGPTMLMYRMECGGVENLYQRLSARQKREEERRPLSAEQVASIVHQLILAVSHLHLGPQVCHRDIKPENFVVGESGDSMLIKLTDFDLSMSPVEGRTASQEGTGGPLCQSVCGTFPFTAPEVVLARPYYGFAADIWSLGIVLLEVFCTIRIVEASLGIANGMAQRDLEGVSRNIHAGFQNQGAVEILAKNIREELQQFLPGGSVVLGGMLNVEVPMRWGAKQVIGSWEEQSESLSVGVAS